MAPCSSHCYVYMAWQLKNLLGVFAMNLIKGEQRLSLFGSLLPQSEIEERLEDRLIARQLLIQKTVEACKAYLERRLAAFDPSVGDQACQIRTLNFSLAFRENKFAEFSTLSENCRKTLEDIESIRKKILVLERLRDEEIALIRKTHLDPIIEESRKVNEHMSKAVEGADKKSFQAIREPFIKSLKSLVSKKEPHEQMIASLHTQCEKAKLILLADIDLQVSQIALTAIQSYILTITREQILEKNDATQDFQYHEHVSVRKLENSTLPFPSRLISGIIEVAKMSLSQSSIAFVRSQASLLKVSDRELIRKMVGVSRVNPKKNREELPFYYLTRVIFDRALELKVPILLKIRNIRFHPLEDKSYVGCIIFVPGDGKYEMVLNSSTKNVEQETIVIHAFSKCTPEELVNVEFQKKMIASAGGILRLVELNTAQHTQFTDQCPKDQNMFGSIPGLEKCELEKLSGLKKEALENGFSNENPALCCIDHILCDRVNIPTKE